MKNVRSLLANVFILIFSFASFVSNVLIVRLSDERFLYIFITSFIYVIPLFVDVLEDFSVMNEHSYFHVLLDLLAIFGGIVYFLILLFMAVAKISPFNLNTLWHNVFMFLLAYLPGVFLLRNLYSVRLSIKQQMACAKVVWRKSRG